jgi:hypothetical protein
VLVADPLVAEPEEPVLLNEDMDLELEGVEVAVLPLLLADVHPYVKAHSSAFLPCRKASSAVDGALCNLLRGKEGCCQASVH